MAARQTRHTLIIAAAALAMGGCKAPSINLATSEPIKVDIDMRLDVYQHNAEGASPAATPKPGAVSPTSATVEPGKRRKDREADVQTFKNSRYVGEGHDGLLVILNAPEGDAGDYVRHMVAAENSDRMTEMKASAKAQKLSLAEVQTGQGDLWRNRSFKGEWIEIRDGNGSYKWIQKQG